VSEDEKTPPTEDSKGRGYVDSVESPENSSVKVIQSLDDLTPGRVGTINAATNQPPQGKSIMKNPEQTMKATSSGMIETSMAKIPAKEGAKKARKTRTSAKKCCPVQQQASSLSHLGIS
jgi:hypothetical protein